MNEGEKTHLANALDANVRFDGRKRDEMRAISVEKGVVATAEGSARVKIGDTEILAGIKMELGTPYSDSPNAGSLMVGAEFLSMASPTFEMGPPGIVAIELARVVDRGIRESDAMDMTKLCVEPGKKAWTVIVDLCTINDNGNLMDAASIATVAALEDAKFPVLEKSEGGDYVIDYKHKTDVSVEMEHKPINVTVYKSGEHYFIDPTRAEEMIFESRLCVAVLENNRVSSLQKGGDGPLTVEDVTEMVKIAVAKTVEIRKQI